MTLLCVGGVRAGCRFEANSSYLRVAVPSLSAMTGARVGIGTARAQFDHYVYRRQVLRHGDTQTELWVPSSQSLETTMRLLLTAYELVPVVEPLP